ncbi:MAG: alanine racemase [Armatimonadota bacterium]
MDHFLRTYALLDIKSLSHNVGIINELLTPGTQIMGVVKGNAYGHGAVTIVPELERLGINRFGVATLSEAWELRDAGCQSDIIILSPVLPQEAEEVFATRSIPLVQDHVFTEAFGRIAARNEQRMAVHLKVDIGMCRFGVAPDQAVQMAVELDKLPGICVTGIATHFPCADTMPELTRAQWEQFHHTAVQAEIALGRSLTKHAAASAATFLHKQTHGDMVRLGLSLYGISPNGTNQQATGLHPMMSIHTRVTALRTVPKGTLVGYAGTYVTERETLIATLGAGYGDCFSRKLSNQGQVLLRGQRVRVVGRVCMDQMMVDATTPGAAIGDDVVIIGRQGTNTITAKEVAGWLETNPHEVCTHISTRVARVLSTSL